MSIKLMWTIPIIGKEDAIDRDSPNYRNNIDNDTHDENNDNDDDHS